MTINHKKCPKCGSLNFVDIVYGYPTADTFLKAEKGEVKIGGCCVGSFNPEYFCKDCEYEWNKEEILNNEYFLKK